MSTTPHDPAWASSPLSVNTLAAPLVQALLQGADVLGLRVQRDASGVCIVDAGIDAPGSVAAGTLIGEICMGGLGRVRLASDGRTDWPDWLEVSSAQPVLAGELQQAIEQRQFINHYQPKVHFATGTLAGVETLVRWDRPVKVVGWRGDRTSNVVSRRHRWGTGGI